MKGRHTWVVKQGSETMRLDKAIRLEMPHLGRRLIKNLLNSKKVKLNGKLLWLGSWLVNPGDRILLLDVPEIKRITWKAFNPDWVIEEADDYVVVNKPSGLLVHAVQDPTRENLEFFMQEEYGKIHPAHRLDRDTSGLIIFSRTREMNQKLDKVFKTHSIQKTYFALVHNSDELLETGRINQRLGAHDTRSDMTRIAPKGKTAVTDYQVLCRNDQFALVKMQPITGRMHQLRVHLAFLNAPIIGDLLYGRERNPKERLMLHARQVILPNGVLKKTVYTANFPPDFIEGIPKEIQKDLPIIEP